MDEQPLSPSAPSTQKQDTPKRLGSETSHHYNLNPQTLMEVVSAIMTITGGTLRGAMKVAFEDALSLDFSGSHELKFFPKYMTALGYLDRTVSKSLTQALEIQVFVENCLNFEPLFTQGEDEKPRLDSSQSEPLRSLVDNMGNRVQDLVDRFDTVFELFSEAFGAYPELATPVKGFDLRYDATYELRAFYNMIRIPDVPEKDEDNWIHLQRLRRPVVCRNCLLTFLYHLRCWWAHIMDEHGKLTLDTIESPDLLRSWMGGIAQHIAKYIHGVHLGITGHLDRFPRNRQAIFEVGWAAEDLIPFAEGGNNRNRDHNVAVNAAISKLRQRTSPSTWTEDNIFKLCIEPLALFREKRRLPMKSLFHRTRMLTFRSEADVVEVHRLKQNGHYALKLAISCYANMWEDRTDRRDELDAKCTALQISWQLGCVNGSKIESNGLKLVAAYPQDIIADTTDLRMTFDEDLKPVTVVSDQGTNRSTRGLELAIPHGATIRPNGLDEFDHSPNGYQIRRIVHSLKQGLRLIELVAIVKLHDPSTKEIYTKLDVWAGCKGEMTSTSRSFARSWKAFGFTHIETEERRINLPLSSLKTTFELAEAPLVQVIIRRV
ncbi:hypothetical protein CVT24_010581 [Panaeolus cyanescens]|uniref:Uncharacterized protein n=1 Tax=Panaeolus cyanescens TaxID=181874 RepID=A0A409WDH7_9AGAR|nr:hypothetical protein CVT24_010581 [Panaeolus cyanescens]